MTATPARTPAAVPGAARAGRGRRRTRLGQLPADRRGQGLRRPPRVARRRARPRRRLRAPDRPGAALAAATSAGTVTGYAPYDARTLRTQLAACPVTVVDVGAVRDPADVDPADEVRPQRLAGRAGPGGRRPGRPGPGRGAGRRATCSSRASSDAGESERLRLAALRGPDVRPGALESSSTRQAGLVQLADLTADGPGPARPAGPGPASAVTRCASARPRTLRDGRGRPAPRPARLRPGLRTRCTPLVPPFFNGLVLAQLLLYGFVAVVWRRRWGSRGHPAAAAARWCAGWR